MSAASFRPFGLVKKPTRFTAFGSAKVPLRLLVAEVLLLVTVPWSVLALGSFYASTLVISTCVLAVACTLAWWPAEPRRLRTSAKLALIAAVALPIFTLLQAVPLPIGMVAVVAPANALVWARALHPLHEPAPAFVPLSLDPTGTRVEVLRGLTYLLAFLTTLRLSARRGRATMFCSAVAVTGGLVAIVTVVHVALGAETVFGIYRPLTAVASRNIGPLLNPNHLAAYLNITICLALGLGLSTDEVRLRALAAALIAGVGALQVWIGSRAGVALMVFALPFVVIVARLRENGASAVGGKRHLVGAVVALAVTGMLVLGFSTSALEELTKTDLSKFTVTLDTLKLVKEHWALGVGRGAFESTYPSVEGMSGYWTHSAPENVIAQWMIEWGVPVSIAGLGCLAFALRPNTCATAARVAVGPWAALVVTALHNLADFNSEMPGVAIALSVCAGIVCASRRRDRVDLPPARRWPRWVALSAAAATIPAIAFVAPAFGHDLLRDRLAIAEAFRDQKVPAAAFNGALRASVLRHPAERYFPYAGAQRAIEDHANPMAWINLALECSPSFGPAHLLLADWLAPLAPPQARLEYRLAMEDDPDVIEVAAIRGARVVSNLSGALELIPSGPHSVRALEWLLNALGSRLPATAAGLDQAILRQQPRHAGASFRRLQAARVDIESGSAAPWCANDRNACVLSALEIANKVVQLDPADCTPRAEEARLLYSAGRTPEALNGLRKAAVEVTDRAACLHVLMDLASSAHDPETAEYAIDRLVHGCSSTEECEAVEVEGAEREVQLGHTARALARYRRILVRAHQRTDLEARVSALSELVEGSLTRPVPVAAPPPPAPANAFETK